MLLFKPPDPSNPPSSYDLAVRFNYTSEDLDAIIEVITYIKSIANSVIISENNIYDAIYYHINGYIQELVQNVLEVPLSLSKGASSNEVYDSINAIRIAFGNWGNQSSDSVSKSKKDFKAHEITPSHNYVSIHQIEVLRCQVEKLILSSSPALQKKGFPKGPPIKGETYGKIHAFLNLSSSWKDLIEVVSVVREVSNLGYMWFREIFIDIDNVLQFPVRSSLPFILSEHLLNLTNKSSLQDSFLFPFEIYNDAAAMAVKTFSSQFLYREIESEVSVCIEMITFSFSDTLYKVCRKTAAGIELPPDCSDKIKVRPDRYDLIVLQNKFDVMGSHVDFNIITTSKLNQKLAKEISNLIAMITDLRLVAYIEHLIRVLRTTHSLLIQNVCVWMISV